MSATPKILTREPFATTSVSTRRCVVQASAAAAALTGAAPWRAFSSAACAAFSSAACAAATISALVGGLGGVQSTPALPTLD